MTIKNAQTEHEIHPILNERWSPRAFSGESVSEDAIMTCFEAARWASSSMNDQPWHFLFVQRDDEAAFKRAVECLAPSNQEWAHAAGAIVFVLVRDLQTYDGKPNRYAEYDTGQSVSQMIVQAWHLGIVAHQMGGFSREKVAESFTLADGHRPHVAIALGPIGSPDSLSEEQRANEVSPRTRRPLALSVSNGSMSLK